MGLIKKAGEAIAGAAGSFLTGGMGLIGGSISGREAAERQYRHEKEMMGLQHQYNEESANSAQKRAQDMWDYTNYESQVEHMRNAGLSIGLMYGNGGGMAASTTGAQGQGVTNAGSQAEAVRAQHLAMGIQLANVASQTKLNEAKANEANANANKTSGVDTDEARGRIDKLIEETQNEKEKRALIKQQTALGIAEERVANYTADLTKENIRKVQYEIEMMGKGIENLIEEIRGKKIDNDIKEKTAEEIIKQAEMTTAQMFKNITKTDAEIGEIAQRINKMKNDMIVDLENAKSNRMKAGASVEHIEVEREKIEQAYTKMLQDFDIAEANLSKEYKELIVDAVAKVIQGALIGKGLKGKGITKED